MIENRTDNRTDREYKKKYSFNVIDLMILLAVVAVFAGVILRYGYYKSEKEKQNKDVFFITVKASGESFEKKNAVEDGDKISFKKNGDFVYPIESVSADEAEVEVMDADGKLRTGLPQTDDEKEKRYDIIIKIKVTGEIKDNGYYIGGTDGVAVGNTVALYAPSFCVQGKVINIDTSSD